MATAPVWVVGAIGALAALSCAHVAPRPPLVRVDQLDEIPTLREFPDSAGADTIAIVATVQIVLDTSGRVVKDMILDMSNPSVEISKPATSLLLQTRFSPPRRDGEPRRALVELSVDSRSRTAIVSPRLSERVVWVQELVDEKPEVLSGPQLWYPDRARQAGISGRVLVQAIIGADGRPEPGSVRLIKPVDPFLDAEAMRYVHNATFKPARIGGRAVRTLVNLPIDFTIGGRR